MNYELVAGPAVEPVTLADAKLAARYDLDALDTQIENLFIPTARQMAEQGTGRQMITQQWRVWFEDWSACVAIERSPLQSVDLVEYWDGAAWRTLSTALYEVKPGPFYASLVPAYNVTWPTLGGSNSYRVRVGFTVGYGDTGSDVPESLRTWILAQVAFWIRNPEAANERDMKPSPFLGALLEGLKVYG